MFSSSDATEASIASVLGGMRAAIFSQSGSAREVLSIVERPTPEPGPGEVRVKIATSGVNPSDVKRRDAKPHGSPAEFPVVIPHSDGAGTIDAVGAGVDSARVGQRVWLYNAQFERPFGTAAEYTVVPQAYAVPLPSGVGFDVGACLGVPALTAYHAIHLDGPAAVQGQTILVQGGAGAVAHYAIQFAKAAGARLIATVSSDEKAAIARAAGADETINYKTENLAQRVKALTDGRGASRVIEVDLSANAGTYGSILADSAKVVVYGSGGTTNLPTLIRLQTTLQFFVVYKLQGAVRQAGLDAVNAMLAAGTLQHQVAQTLPLEQIADAHELVESGKVIGNVLIAP